MRTLIDRSWRGRAQNWLARLPPKAADEVLTGSIGVVCPRCGAKLPDGKSCQELSDELYAYTLTHGSSEFIHQYVVDAYAAQHLAPESKPIYAAAARIGLSLFCELGYTGRQVQQAHVALGNKMKAWPRFQLPPQHAALKVTDVLQVPPGAERNASIKQWARAVWETRRDCHTGVEQWLSKHYSSFQGGF